MSIGPIESVTDQVRAPEALIQVPGHITAAAQSLGISAAQMSQAFSVGASLADVAQTRGISQEDLLSAMEANPPANLAVVVAARGARQPAPTGAGALDVLA
ncbi:hypothetical protein [Pengzhenrongella sicca]|uniref:Uncharacterized protein n=1 Tax=Pengzhenrongella sicca TaxID=2819238 RepID=A0A8A4ZBE0_9MICO|nr:hypothetical protein [Pengzhenrongella sicca]QTE28329.1 hypothetical protein J4E96_13180 [Pengzhenrongella sicca]